MNIFIEGLKQLPVRVIHARANLLIHLFLQLLECGLYLVKCAAFLVDAKNSLLEIHAGLNGSKYFVGGTKDAAEEAEFLAEESTSFLSLRKLITTTSNF